MLFPGTYEVMVSESVPVHSTSPHGSGHGFSMHQVLRATAVPIRAGLRAVVELIAAPHLNIGPFGPDAGGVPADG